MLREVSGRPNFLSSSLYHWACRVADRQHKNPSHVSQSRVQSDFPVTDRFHHAHGDNSRYLQDSRSLLRDYKRQRQTPTRKHQRASTRQLVRRGDPRQWGAEQVADSWAGVKHDSCHSSMTQGRRTPISETETQCRKFDTSLPTARGTEGPLSAMCRTDPLTAAWSAQAKSTEDSGALNVAAARVRLRRAESRLRWLG